MKSPEHALLVERGALAAHYIEVEAFQTSRAKSARRLSKVLVVIATAAVFGNIAQAFTIATMVPLAKLVPVYLWVRPDGTVDSEVSVSRLPATQEQAVITASLWQYVRLREGIQPTQLNTPMISYRASAHHLCARNISITLITLIRRHRRSQSVRGGD